MAKDDPLKVSVISEPVQPTDETFPHISKALIEKLEHTFQDRCPPLHLDMKEIWFRCGQVNVVQYLRAEYQRQRDERNRG